MNEELPPVGIPLISPVPAASVNPAGSVPELTAQVTAPTAPEAVRVWLYNVPTVPFGNVVGKIVNTPITVSVYARVPVCVNESVDCTVNDDDPAAVGVPLKTPVPDASIKPAGSVPTVTAHVTAPVAPEAEIVWLYTVPTVPLGNVAGAIPSGPSICNV